MLPRTIAEIFDPSKPLACSPEIRKLASEAAAVASRPAAGPEEVERWAAALARDLARFDD